MIAERIKKNARDRPDKMALGDWRNYTYRDLDERSDFYAVKFAKAGFEKGSRVVFAVKPGPELYFSLFGLLKLGAVPVLADPAMGFWRVLYCYRSAKPQGIVFKIGDRVKSLKIPPFVKGGSGGIFAVNFTTGSTGPAKGAEYTDGMLEAMLLKISKQYDHGPDSVSYSTLSLFGFFDLLLGSTVLSKPNPEVTHVFTSPALLNQIAFSNMPHLKHVICGGSAPQSSQIPKLRDTTQFHVTYGATEALPIASTTNYQPGCLGTPLIDVKIIDDEICISGPSVSASYYNNSQANQQHKLRLEGKLWHRTGDLGYFDSEGQLWSLGRKSDVVHTQHGLLYTVPIENYYNAKLNARTALVGVGPKGSQIPILCIESAKKFPVDIRHQSKIRRDQLTRWAEKKMTYPPWLKIVPIAAWIFIAYGFWMPAEPKWLWVCWWLNAFLTPGLHILELYWSIPVGRKAGYSVGSSILMTMFLGATWWKSNLPARVPKT